jgi:hypothetical protein
MRIYSALPIAVFFSVFIAFGQAADPVAWLPAEINAVARINVSELYKSSLAQQEGWVKKSTEAFIQQEAFVPPGTSALSPLETGIGINRTFRESAWHKEVCDAEEVYRSVE